MDNFKQTTNQEVSLEENIRIMLLNKMTKEMKQWESYLKASSPEFVLTNAYEYAIKSDILLAMENEELEPVEALLLLQMENPLNSVYEWFANSDSSYHMEKISSCISECAKWAWRDLKKENSEEEPSQEAEKELDCEENNSGHTIMVGCTVNGLAVENLIEIVNLFNEVKDKMHLLETHSYEVWKNHFADWANDFEEMYKDTDWTADDYLAKIRQFALVRFQMLLRQDV